ncbi:DUF2236 domain-containing protein [Nocardia flavorosea]|uniref:oxygenase MpaB family protein n=1 Tax=Nocardia flavorosea TaxID=53429 RepID=UPI0018963615|nr:DUF2236 domain-containing protein [Nocardia flavorosea]
MDRSGPRAAHPRPDDPTDRAAFRTYIDHTVATGLERNSTTDLLIELDRHPMPPPPELRVPRWLWNVPAVPVAALLRLTTAGYLPPVLRPRLGVEWSPARPPVRPAGARGRPTGSVAPGACPLSTVRSVHARRGLPAGCDPVLTHELCAARRNHHRCVAPVYRNRTPKISTAPVQGRDAGPSIGPAHGQLVRTSDRSSLHSVWYLPSASTRS